MPSVGAGARIERLAAKGIIFGLGSLLPACRLLRDFLALLARFRQADGDRLLAAFHLAGLAAGTAFGGALLVAAHLALDVLAGALGIFPLRFLLGSHGILLSRRDAPH